MSGDDSKTMQNLQDSGKFEKLTSTDPGEEFEPRQQIDEDQEPDPSKSIPLNAARQALIDDIIELYSCRPTIKRVERYTRDCVYNDQVNFPNFTFNDADSQFVYANNRYKMAGQWFALPKGFNDSTNLGYQIIKNDRLLIQFKNKQSWTFKGIPKTAVINALVSLSLDPDTADSDFPLVKFHKDQANDKDYSNRGIGHFIKKFQADHVSDLMSDERVQHFKNDQGDDLTAPVKTYEGSGTTNNQIGTKPA